MRTCERKRTKETKPTNVSIPQKKKQKEPANVGVAVTYMTKIFQLPSLYYYSILETIKIEQVCTLSLIFV